MLPELECLSAGVFRLKTQSRVGRVTRISPSVIQVTGLSDVARIGDEVVIRRKDCPPLEAEVIAINDSEITLLPEDNPKNITLFDKVILLGEREIFPILLGWAASSTPGASRWIISRLHPELSRCPSIHPHHRPGYAALWVNARLRALRL